MNRRSVDRSLSDAPPAMIAACGIASRFGRPKLFEPIDGETVIHRTLAALRRGGAGRFLVSVRPHERAILEAITDVAGVGVVENSFWKEGMASSYRALARLLPPEAPFALASPADLPWLEPESVRVVIEAATRDRDRLVVPVFRGTPGHPVAIPAALLARAGELRGDEGFRAFRGEALLVEVRGAGCCRDVDSTSDLA